MKALTLEVGVVRPQLAVLWSLTKPRVNALILFCALIGMLLAVPAGEMPPWSQVLPALFGIAAVAGAAAAMNCLLEQHIDARMQRTRRRALPRGEVQPQVVLVFAGTLGGLGLTVLYHWVNPLTMGLTLATFVGYAVIYTAILKPRTPQNIVIGGASGAMPPVLGWAAVTGSVSHDALLLFLIIFAWTPPHFWSLALYRVDDYARAGLPMLPVTHGKAFTCLSIVLYTLILLAVSVLPFTTRMSGPLYLLCAVVLGLRFMGHALGQWRAYSDARARRTFRYSIVYLSLLFSALLLDHYLMV